MQELQSFSGGVHNILIVDDNSVDRQLYREYLSGVSEVEFVVEEADSAEQAERMLEFSREKVDCILLDYNLPDVYDLELFTRITERYRSIAIVIVTGQERGDVIFQVLKQGAEDYLLKDDCTAKSLVRAVRYAIERKKAKMEMLELSLALEKQKSVNQLQRDFVSMVSHEFRTPLAIVDTSAQIILREEGRTDTVAKHAEKILRSVRRLLRLLESTLNLSRMEGGKVVARPKHFNPRALLEETCEKLREVYSERNILLEVEGSVPQNFYADPELCEQILNNLITNALKYSAQNKPVRVKADVIEDDLRIVVEDKGVGISEKDKMHVGEKFFRTKNTEGIPGTGIGLYLTRYFAEIQGGHLVIESEEGAGTRVTVSLPVRIQGEQEGEERQYA